jgi:hypothetical protein
VKQSVYFFRWGITIDMSFTSSRTSSLLLASCPFDRPFCPVPLAGREGTCSSNRRFFDTGSEDSGIVLHTWSDI